MNQVSDSFAEERDNNGFIINSYFIPEEIVTYILSFVDPAPLVFHCRLVCKRWKQLIEEQHVWKHKMKKIERTSFSKLSQADRIQLNLPWYLYFVIFYYDPFEKNLLRNNCGQKRFKYWSVLSGFEEESSIENVPAGADALPESSDFENNTCCFVSSYNLCKKSQLISLSEIGITELVMNKIQPEIIVSEWFAGRYDCGCKYKLTASLLNDRHEILYQKEEERQINQWEGRDWKKVTIIFKNYGPGVRHILFDHEGKDTKFWAGHYGSKMSGGMVTITLPTTSIKSLTT